MTERIAAVGSGRPKIVERVADHLVAQRVGHTLRVGVDGISAAGKSTFALELVAAVRARGRPAIHLSMDDFHHERAHRYRQGRDSAVGYYHDAYDFDALAKLVLFPLGPGGDGRYTARVLDLQNDTAFDEPPIDAPEHGVLIVDGTFLQRAELAGLWDETVFVDTSFSVARDRAIRRDAEIFGGVDQAARAVDNRYHAAARLYLDEFDPAEQATIVLGNDHVEHPVLCRIGGRASDSVSLFSYGTLQQLDVQMSSFGRQLQGTPDTLTGYRYQWVTIIDAKVIAASGSDRHPIATLTGDPRDAVEGTVFTLSPPELAAADQYEVDHYRRVLATLGSGADSWVYVATESETTSVPGPGC
jgi:uridine kinase